MDSIPRAPLSKQQREELGTLVTRASTVPELTLLAAWGVFIIIFIFSDKAEALGQKPAHDQSRIKASLSPVWFELLVPLVFLSVCKEWEGVPHFIA